MLEFRQQIAAAPAATILRRPSPQIKVFIARTGILKDSDS
jgi:hypothetical protein